MQLASIYRSPGILLLAQTSDGKERVGCVGLRPLDGQAGDHNLTRVGELRRLFVRPGYRRENAGARLTESVIAHARKVGMTRLVLNTLPQMTEAVALYERLGFTSCQSYLGEPTAGVRYFSLSLDEPEETE